MPPRGPGRRRPRRARRARRITRDGARWVLLVAGESYSVRHHPARSAVLFGTPGVCQIRQTLTDLDECGVVSLARRSCLTAIDRIGATRSPRPDPQAVTVTMKYTGRRVGKYSRPASSTIFQLTQHLPGRLGAVTRTRIITCSPGGVSPICTRSGVRQPAPSAVGSIRARYRLCQSTFPTFARAHTLSNWALTFTWVPSGMVTSPTNLLESPGISESENAVVVGDATGDGDAVGVPGPSGSDRPRTVTPRTAATATTSTTAAALSHGSRRRRLAATPSSARGYSTTCTTPCSFGADAATTGARSPSPSPSPPGRGAGPGRCASSQRHRHRASSASHAR